MRRFKKEKPLYVFFHIPKSGGTSIRLHFKRAFGEKHCLFLYPRSFDEKFDNLDETKSFLEKMTQEEKDNVDIIAGHWVYYGIHEYFGQRTARYITFIRNPVERVTSLFNHLLMNRFKKNICGEASFEEWLKHDDQSGNNMVHYLAGRRCDISDREKLELAKNALGKFFYVGLTERASKDIRLLDFLMKADGKRLPLVNTSAQNLGVLGVRPYQPSEKEIEMIKDRNRQDVELYEFAKNMNQGFHDRHLFKMNSYKFFSRLISSIFFMRR